MTTAAELNVGTKIRLDGKYSGYIRFKGELEGRKGQWLGLEMDDTVGDNDGTIGGKKYFSTHDGQGLFLRADAGRVVSAEKSSAQIPEEMLEHMKFLFSAFDEDNSGDINQEELYHAMQLLGQKATKKHVKHIFEEIDEDNSGTIDFHEFVDVMQVQWKGMDLSRAVKMIKDAEAAEAKKNEIDLAPVEVLYANFFGIKLHLRFFGAGMNAFLLFVYGFASLAALYYLLWRDLFNQLLVISLGGMSALFAIGGYTIHAHQWVTIKVYSILMFFGAGAQIAMCCMFYFGFFTVSGTVVKLVMDEKCGTCLDESASCNKVTLTGSLIGDPEIDYSNLPWYCCCALNECFDFSTVVTAPSECVDNCTSAEMTGSDTDARGSCFELAGRFQSEGREGLGGKSADTGQICAFLGEVTPVPRSCDPPTIDPDRNCDIGGVNVRGAQTLCTDAGCSWQPEIYAAARTCRQAEGVDVNCDDARRSEEECNGKGTCRFIPSQMGAEPELDADMTKANDFCGTNEDYTSRSDLGITGRTSRLGNDRCFVKESDSDVEIEGSMAKCVEEFQQESQEAYVIFILAMSPFQIIAAYVGWVLPDLYFRAHNQAKEDAALAQHSASTAFESESTENAVFDK